MVQTYIDLREKAIKLKAEKDESGEITKESIANYKSIKAEQRTLNGLITSIFLETFILIRQNFSFIAALKTASGMSLISMLSMEIMMNLTDYLLTGGAMLTWWVIPIMLIVGFLTPWPYNYWRLKKFGIDCH